MKIGFTKTMFKLIEHLNSLDSPQVYRSLHLPIFLVSQN